MKIPISPGWWLLYVSITDLVVGFANIYYDWWDPVLTSVAYCAILSLPLWIKPIGRWVGVKLLWE